MSCATTLPVTLYRGRSIAFTVRLTDNCSQLPIDLAPYTEIDVRIAGIGTAPPVKALLSLSEVVKLSPVTGGQIKVKYTAADTLLMGLTNADPDAPVYSDVWVYLTDPANDDQNPYIIKLAGIFNILDPAI